MNKSPAAPKTLEEAVDNVIRSLNPEEQREFALTPENELTKYHFSLGLWIRNNFELWDESSSLVKDLKSKNMFSHPDDISGDIISAAWHKLQKSK